MAEVAASIVALVTFGTQITKKLYEAGNCISSLRKDTNNVANGIRLYSGVLECLAERLRSDHPVYSPKALSMAEELYYESKIFFNDIKSLLPNRDRSSNGGCYSWREKVKWYFRKKQVIELVGKLEGLKATVNLLATVLLAGDNHRKKDRAKTKEAIGNASAAVVDYINTAERLSRHQTSVERDQHERVPPDCIKHGELVVLDTSRTALIVHDSAHALTRLNRDLSRIADPVVKQEKLLSQSQDVVVELLHEWTCVMDEQPTEDLAKPIITEASSRPTSPEHIVNTQFPIEVRKPRCGKIERPQLPEDFSLPSSPNNQQPPAYGSPLANRDVTAAKASFLQANFFWFHDGENIFTETAQCTREQEIMKELKDLVRGRLHPPREVVLQANISSIDAFANFEKSLEAHRRVCTTDPSTP